MKIVRLVILAICMAAMWPAPVNGQPTITQPKRNGGPDVNIVIDQPSMKKFAISIPDFVPNTGGTGGPDMTRGLSDRLAANLDMTGIFVSLDRRTFMETNPMAGVGNVPLKFQEWRAIGSELVIKGAFTLTGDQLTLELRLYDVFESRQRLGKRYTGSRQDARTMINRFTNLVLHEITGEYGVFGTKIVFRRGARLDKRIYTTEFGSDESVGVGGGPGPCSMPTIAADGTVAYIHRNDNQGRRHELFVGGRQVFTWQHTIVSPAFTPGGGLLVALTGKHSTNIFRIEGDKSIRITNLPGINISPSVSPDGSRMAFMSDRSGRAQIYVASISGGAVRRLTDGKQNTDPDWSPRGDRIVFCGSASDIFTIKPDGSDLQQLTSGAGRNTRPSWSPDGRMIVFASTRQGRSQLYTMTANGERQQPLMPDDPGDQHTPYWSKGKPELGVTVKP